ncbi:MAG: Hsp70 family protein [Myxococcales bacterium]|nr:Hsp70 family protein [Myxococcales bacterium]
MTVVGIDLGTTNTVVGVVKDGHAAALADEAGDRLIPSVVSFHPSGNVLVGKPAKERRLVDATNTVYSIKRLIGRSWDSEEVRKARERFPFEMREGPGQAALVVARGQSYTLPEISAFVLRRAKAIAETALGGHVEKAVITVPANFNDLQRAATKVAGRVAGLEVLRILNEPTAAALAYGYGKSTNERIAVYDFGGGTFDVTLLDLSENVFEVLATAGNTFLGGDDIDLELAERMATAFLQKHRIDPRGDPQAFERLRAAAEELKIRLSRENEVTLHLAEIAHGPGGKSLDLEFRMTRGDFEGMVGPIVERTFEVCREAMNIARLSSGDFDQVLLVGGSTRIPLVRQSVEAFFKRPVLGHISPDEVVAIGAAIQAAALTGATERRRDLPPAPAPAARGPIARRGNTWPPNNAQSPPMSAEPGTEPYGGRSRSPTSPGVQADSGARQLPAGAAQRVVVPGEGRPRVPTGAGVAPPPGTEPPGTVAGLGARGRTPTGPGLGPEAAAARARVQTNTLSSAESAAEKARRMTDPGIGSDGPSQIVPPTKGPINLPGLDDPTAEAGHIASFLARYASTPQKPRTTQPQGPIVTPKEESVSYRLSEDDIQYEDPSALQAPNTAQLRRMAGPQSTDEVTEVHKRRTGSRVSIDEQALPLPSIPDDEDMTMDTATSPQAQAPFGGTMRMPQQPPPPPARGLPGSLATPTSPNPALAGMPGPTPGPFGQPNTLVSPATSGPGGMPAPGAPSPFGGSAPPAFQHAFPPPPHAHTSPFGSPEPQAPPAEQWAPPLGVAAGIAGIGAAANPVIQQMPGGAGTPLLVDVTPLTLTVETVHGYCDPVIGRNSPVPCERSRTFVTAADNQTTVRVRVAQGESKLFRENTLLGEVELSGLRGAARGQVKIDVVFGLDTDGILNVRAVDVATGHEARVTVRLVAVPDMGNVAEMAARNAAMPMMS